MSEWLFDDPPLVLQRSVVRRFGAADALIFQQLHYWLKRSRNEMDGEVWVYKTNAEWDEELGLMAATVRGALARLTESGVVVMRQPNGFDRTKWYRIDYSHPLADPALEAIKPYHLRNSQMGAPFALSDDSNRRNPSVPSALSDGCSSTTESTQESTAETLAQSFDLEMVAPSPEPTVSSIATALVKRVYAEKQPAPVANIRGAISLAMRAINAGHTPEAVRVALMAAPAITAGALDFQLSRPNGKTKGPDFMNDSDRDEPSGRYFV